MSEAEQAQLKLMSEDKNIQKHITESLFPNIFGSDEVRKPYF